MTFNTDTFQSNYLQERQLSTLSWKVDILANNLLDATCHFCETLPANILRGCVLIKDFKRKNRREFFLVQRTRRQLIIQRKTVVLNAFYLRDCIYIFVCFKVVLIQALSGSLLTFLKNTVFVEIQQENQVFAKACDFSVCTKVDNFVCTKVAKMVCWFCSVHKGLCTLVSFP